VNGSSYFVLNFSCDVDVVGADAEHLGAALAEDVVRVAELARLRRAPGVSSLG
jgi:hypothetical protein